MSNATTTPVTTTPGATALGTAGRPVAERIQQRPATTPHVDIYESKDELLIVADLPGVATNDVTIHFEKGQISLEGRRDPKTQGAVLAAEYLPADFRRTFLVPQGIDAEKISAEHKDGVLRLHLPKLAALRARQISIKSG